MGKVWLTRGGSDGEWEEFALENGVTGGGWLNVPDLSQATTYEAVRTLVHEGRPTKGNGTIGNWAGQLYSLRTNISIGDFALMPLKGEGVVAVGVISSDYIYDGSQEPPHRHYRKVDWKKKDVPKTVFGSDLQRSLGTFMTICEIARHEAFDRISTIVSTGIDPFVDSSEAVDGNTAPSVDLIPPNVINDAAISIQELIRLYAVIGPFPQ